MSITQISSEQQKFINRITNVDGKVMIFVEATSLFQRNEDFWHWALIGTAVGTLSLKFLKNPTYFLWASIGIPAGRYLFEIFRNYLLRRTLKNETVEALNSIPLKERLYNLYNRSHMLLGLPPARKEAICRALKVGRPPTFSARSGNNTIFFNKDLLQNLCSFLEPKDVMTLAQTCYGYYMRIKSTPVLNKKYAKLILKNYSILPAQDSSLCNAHHEASSPFGIARGKEWLLLNNVHDGGVENSLAAIPRLELVDLREGKNLQSTYVQIPTFLRADLFSYVLDPKTGWPNKIYCLYSLRG